MKAINLVWDIKISCRVRFESLSTPNSQLRKIGNILKEKIIITRIQISEINQHANNVIIGLVEFHGRKVCLHKEDLFYMLLDLIPFFQGTNFIFTTTIQYKECEGTLYD